MANEDFGEAFDTWYKQLASAMSLSTDDRAKITGAGAKAFSEAYVEETPVSTETYETGRSAGHANAKHANSHRKTKHLKDAYTYSEGYTADGNKTGDTDVGQESKYYDFLAKIISNGRNQPRSAKEYANMHYRDRAQSKAKAAMLSAMLVKYKQVSGAGGGS